MDQSSYYHVLEPPSRLPIFESPPPSNISPNEAPSSPPAFESEIPSTDDPTYDVESVSKTSQELTPATFDAPQDHDGTQLIDKPEPHAQIPPPAHRDRQIVGFEKSDWGESMSTHSLGPLVREAPIGTDIPPSNQTSTYRIISTSPWSFTVTITQTETASTVTKVKTQSPGSTNESAAKRFGPRLLISTLSTAGLLAWLMD
jgi:hypothetical protein